MKKFLLTIIFSLIGLTLLNAQEFRGKVTNAHNNQAVEGVNISFSNELFTTTNRNGEFYLPHISKEKYLLRASHINYHMKEVEVNTASGFAEISLEPSDINLDEVIVTSSRHEQYIKNLPYSALLVDNEKLESNISTGVPDILKDEPGVNLVRDGVWATDISIRGLSRSNIVTLVDGIRLETSNDLAARLSMIDLNDVDRIEIIKGASSSLYGSGATGGVVNIISRSVEFSDRFFLNGNLSVGYNSVNNSRVFSGGVVSGNSFWTSKVTGSLRRADDIKTPAGDINNSQFSDMSVSGTLNVNPFKHNYLRVNYQLFKAEDVGVPGGYPLFPDKALVTYPDAKREMASAQYEVRNLSDLISKISLKYSYQFILRNVENIPFQVQNIPAQGNQPARRVNVLKITPGADHHTNSLQFQTDFILSERNFLLAGIDIWKRSYQGKRERHQLIEVLGADGTTVVKTINKVITEKPLPDSDYRSVGFFIQDEHQLIPQKLQLSLGARIDQIRITGERTLNPLFETNDGVINYTPANQKVIWEKEESDELSYSGNLGLLYSLISNVDLTLNAGYSFRSPSLEERFQYIDLGNLLRIGNPDLKSERGYFFDLGTRYRTERFRASASLFFNSLNDLVVEEPGTYENRPARIKTNIGEARLYGFDASLDYNIFSSFTTYVNAAYVRGEDLKENTNLPQISPMNGTAGFSYTPIENLSVDISSVFFFQQNKTAAGEVSTPGYVYFNAMLGYRPAAIYGGKIQLFAGVENILDKNFRNHLSTNRGSITVEPGRNIYLKTVINL